MVVKTPKVPKKTVTKKIASSTVKKEEIPTTNNDLSSIENKVETIVKEVVVEIEKDIQQTEKLAKTTVPYITNFFKKLKFW